MVSTLCICLPAFQLVSLSSFSEWVKHKAVNLLSQMAQSCFLSTGPPITSAMFCKLWSAHSNFHVLWSAVCALICSLCYA